MDEEKNDIAALQQERDEYLAGWKRAQADYANLKKEMDRERSDFAKYANERLLDELLPAIDHYETALSYLPDVEALPDDLKPRWKTWITGIEAVRALWQNAFQSIGLTQVPCRGPFDPRFHEAVGHEPSTEVPAEHILRVMQDGWKLNGRVLRPAQVIVARAVDSVQSS